MPESDLVHPQRVQSPDGSYNVSGCVVRGVVLPCLNVDTSTVTAGMVVGAVVSGANCSTIGRWDVGQLGNLKQNVIKCYRADISNVVLGVALEDAKPGQIFELACDASFVAVRCTGSFVSAPSYAVLSASPGLVAESATPVVGKTLGIVLVYPGTGSDQTGSTGIVGVHICRQ